MGVKTGAFRAKSGSRRSIIPLFSTDSPSPREKTTFTRLFTALKLGDQTPCAGKNAGRAKEHTHILLSFSYLISTNVCLTHHDALRFSSAFASVFSLHRAAQNTTAAASKGCEGKNAKVFTPNAQWNNELRKVGEEVKEKNEKWRRRARTRAREGSLSQRAAGRQKHVPLSTAEAHREGNGKWRTENGELINPRLCW